MTSSGGRSGNIRWLVGIFLIGVAVVGASVLIAIFGAYRAAPVVVKRPGNVPSDAVLIPGGKVLTSWARCAIEKDAEVHCQIFNEDGWIRHDDIFLPYGAPAEANELTIDSHYSGPDWVWLTNDRLLLPRTITRSTSNLSPGVLVES